MIITNKLEKNTIICALKVQLKRLSKDKKELREYIPLAIVLALNEEISRIKSLISSMERE